MFVLKNVNNFAVISSVSLSLFFTFVISVGLRIVFDRKITECSVLNGIEKRTNTIYRSQA